MKCPITKKRMFPSKKDAEDEAWIIGKGKPDFQLAVKAGVRDKNGKLLI